MIQKAVLATAVSLSFGLLAAMGCGGASPPTPKRPATKGVSHDHDHEHGHDHEHAENHEGHHAQPESLAEATTALKEAIADVAKHLASDTADAADDAVHEIGHLLEHTEKLIAGQDWAADAKEAATKAVAELTDCFDKLDQSLHAASGTGDTPSAVHASISERVAAALAVLESRLASTKSEPDPVAKPDTKTSKEE